MEVQVDSKSVNKGFIKAVRESPLRTGKITPEVVTDQLNKVCQRVGSYTFNLKIFVAKEEEERLQAEPMKTKRRAFSKLISCEKITPTGSGGFNHTIDVMLSPFDAFNILKAGNVELSYRIRNDWVKNRSKEADSKKIIDPQNPIMGISTGLHFSGPTIEESIDREKIIDIPPYDGMSNMEKTKVLETLMEKHLRSAVIQVSHEYEVFDRYAQDQKGNADDFVKLRIGLWHEIIETALIFIVTEAFCFPLSIYNDICKDLDSQGSKSTFAHLGMETFQKNLASNRSILLYWAGDPAFDVLDVSAYLAEAEAVRLEELALLEERQGSWAGARERWKEAEEAWKKAIEAWRAVTQRPDRDQRLEAGRKRLAEAREKYDIARWMLASWDVSASSAGEITIRYSSWPVRFQARIADVKGKCLATLDKPGGAGVIIWGKGQPQGLYFIKVDGDRIEPGIRKIVLY